MHIKRSRIYSYDTSLFFIFFSHEFRVSLSKYLCKCMSFGCENVAHGSFAERYFWLLTVLLEGSGRLFFVSTVVGICDPAFTKWSYTTLFLAMGSLIYTHLLHTGNVVLLWTESSSLGCQLIQITKLMSWTLHIITGLSIINTALQAYTVHVNKCRKRQNVQSNYALFDPSCLI